MEAVYVLLSPNIIVAFQLFDFYVMKRLIILTGFLTIFTLLNAAAKGTPLSLYSEWQSLSVDKLMKMGERFDLHNSSDSALVCYSVVADRLRNNTSDLREKRALSRALNNMGYIYATFFFDYPKALELFQESLEISETCDYQKNEAFVYLNIGGVYLGCNFMYGKCLFAGEGWNYLGKALDAGIATGQYEIALVAFLNMGQLFFEDPQKDKIIEAVMKLKTAAIPDKTNFYTFTRRYADGLEAYIKGDYLNSARLFEGSSTLISSDGMHARRLELISLAAVAEAQEAMGRYQDAISTVESLLNKSQAAGSSDEETRAYRKLSALYEKSGNPQLANEFLFQYLHKKDSTLSERDITMLSKMPFVNELEHIKLQLDEERARKRRLIIIASVSSLFLILLVLYVITLIRSQRKIKLYVKDLYRKNIELMKSERRERELREAEAVARAEEKEEENVKYAASSLTENESRRIADRILEVMADTELITSADFTMEKLAEKIGCPYKYVSQVVNETFGKNFRSLLNEYRIKEACVRLADTDRYGSYTIESVAETLGFNSRSNFSVTFKKITGLTPAQFQKSALDEQ